MPKIKLFVIDQEDFIFSWYPVSGVSCDSVCFHVKSNHQNNNKERIVIDQLMTELQNIQTGSVTLEPKVVARLK